MDSSIVWKESSLMEVSSLLALGVKFIVECKTLKVGGINIEKYFIKLRVKHRTILLYDLEFNSKEEAESCLTYDSSLKIATHQRDDILSTLRFNDVLNYDITYNPLGEKVAIAFINNADKSDFFTLCNVVPNNLEIQPLEIKGKTVIEVIDYFEKIKEEEYDNYVEALVNSYDDY